MQASDSNADGHAHFHSETTTTSSNNLSDILEKVNPSECGTGVDVFE
jgi:hypothetical protein